jgi:hypothetical protein
MCQLEGVDCNEMGRTTHLVMRDLHLQSTLSANFSSFDEAIHMDLRGNDLGGSLVSLSQGLLHLDMGENMLTGAIPALNIDIKKRVNRRTKESFLSIYSPITVLRMDHNELRGDLPSGVWELCQMGTGEDNVFEDVECDFSCNRFNYQNVQRGFFNELFEKTNFDPQKPSWIETKEWLDERDCVCERHGNECDAEMGIIRSVDLTGNGLVGKLPTGNWPDTLHSFVISDNAVSGELPILTNLTEMWHLDVSQNELEGDLARLWPQSLTHVDISYNNLTGSLPNQFKSICGNFNDPTNENCLYHCNRFAFQEKQRDFLALFLTMTSKDQKWAQDANWLVGGACICDFYGIACDGKIGNIERVDLADNQLSGELPETQEWPVFIKSVDIRQNAISGIIPSLHHLKTLDSVDLSNNNLGGRIPFQWPSSIRRIAIKNNLLIGTLPPLGGLENLESLDISGNVIQGPFPHYMEKGGFTRRGPGALSSPIVNDDFTFEWEGNFLFSPDHCPPGTIFHRWKCYDCRVSSSCNGTHECVPENINSTQVMSTGSLCGQCNDGYFLSRNSCVKCPGVPFSAVLVVLMVVFGARWASKEVLSIRCNLRGKALEAAEEAYLFGKSAAAYVKPITDPQSKEERSGEHELNIPAFVTLFRIAITTLQLCAMAFELNTPLAPDLQNLGYLASVSMFSINSKCMSVVHHQHRFAIMFGILLFSLSFFKVFSSHKRLADIKNMKSLCWTRKTHLLLEYVQQDHIVFAAAIVAVALPVMGSCCDTLAVLEGAADQHKGDVTLRLRSDPSVGRTESPVQFILECLSAAVIMGSLALTLWWWFELTLLKQSNKLYFSSEMRTWAPVTESFGHGYYRTGLVFFWYQMAAMFIVKFLFATPFLQTTSFFLLVTAKFMWSCHYRPYYKVFVINPGGFSKVDLINRFDLFANFGVVLVAASVLHSNLSQECTCTRTPMCCSTTMSGTASTFWTLGIVVYFLYFFAIVVPETYTAIKCEKFSPRCIELHAQARMAEYVGILKHIADSAKGRKSNRHTGKLCIDRKFIEPQLMDVIKFGTNNDIQNFTIKCDYLLKQIIVHLAKHLSSGKKKITAEVLDILVDEVHYASTAARAIKRQAESRYNGFESRRKVLQPSFVRGISVPKEENPDPSDNLFNALGKLTLINLSPSAQVQLMDTCKNCIESSMDNTLHPLSSYSSVDHENTFDALLWDGANTVKDILNYEETALAELGSYKKSVSEFFHNRIDKTLAGAIDRLALCLKRYIEDDAFFPQWCRGSTINRDFVLLDIATVSKEAKRVAGKILNTKEKILSDYHEISHAVRVWTEGRSKEGGNTENIYSKVQIFKLRDCIEESTNMALVKVVQRYCEFLCVKLMDSHSTEVGKCNPYVKPRDPTVFFINEAVEVRYQGRKAYHPGKVVSVTSDNKYFIQYDDGAKEDNVDHTLVRLLLSEESPPNAEDEDPHHEEVGEDTITNFNALFAKYPEERASFRLTCDRWKARVTPQEIIFKLINREQLWEKSYAKKGLDMALKGHHYANIVIWRFLGPQVDKVERQFPDTVERYRDVKEKVEMWQESAHDKWLSFLVLAARVKVAVVNILRAIAKGIQIAAKFVSWCLAKILACIQGYTKVKIPVTIAPIEIRTDDVDFDAQLEDELSLGAQNEVTAEVATSQNDLGNDAATELWFPTAKNSTFDASKQHVHDVVAKSVKMLSEVVAPKILDFIAFLAKVQVKGLIKDEIFYRAEMSAVNTMSLYSSVLCQGYFNSLEVEPFGGKGCPILRIPGYTRTRPPPKGAPDDELSSFWKSLSERPENRIFGKIPDLFQIHDRLGKDFEYMTRKSDLITEFLIQYSVVPAQEFAKNLVEWAEEFKKSGDPAIPYLQILRVEYEKCQDSAENWKDSETLRLARARLTYSECLGHLVDLCKQRHQEVQENASDSKDSSKVVVDPKTVASAPAGGRRTSAILELQDLKKMEEEKKKIALSEKRAREEEMKAKAALEEAHFDPLEAHSHEAHLKRIHSLLESNEWQFVFKTSRFLSLVQKNMNPAQLGEAAHLLSMVNPRDYGHQFPYIRAHLSQLECMDPLVVEGDALLDNPLEQLIVILQKMAKHQAAKPRTPPGSKQNDVEAESESMSPFHALSENTNPVSAWSDFQTSAASSSISSYDFRCLRDKGKIKQVKHAKVGLSGKIQVYCVDDEAAAAETVDVGQTTNKFQSEDKRLAQKVRKTELCTYIGEKYYFGKRSTYAEDTWTQLEATAVEDKILADADIGEPELPEEMIPDNRMQLISALQRLTVSGALNFAVMLFHNLPPKSIMQAIALPNGVGKCLPALSTMSLMYTRSGRIKMLTALQHNMTDRQRQEVLRCLGDAWHRFHPRWSQTSRSRSLSISTHEDGSVASLNHYAAETTVVGGHPHHIRASIRCAHPLPPKGQFIFPVSLRGWVTSCTIGIVDGRKFDEMMEKDEMGKHVNSKGLLDLAKAGHAWVHTIEDTVTDDGDAKIGIRRPENVDDKAATCFKEILVDMDGGSVVFLEHGRIIQGSVFNGIKTDASTRLYLAVTFHGVEAQCQLGLKIPLARRDCGGDIAVASCLSVKDLLPWHVAAILAKPANTTTQSKIAPGKVMPAAKANSVSARLVPLHGTEHSYMTNEDLSPLGRAVLDAGYEYVRHGISLSSDMESRVGQSLYDGARE